MLRDTISIQDERLRRHAEDQIRQAVNAASAANLAIQVGRFSQAADYLDSIQQQLADAANICRALASAERATLPLTGLV